MTQITQIHDLIQFAETSARAVPVSRTPRTRTWARRLPLVLVALSKACAVVAILAAFVGLWIFGVSWVVLGFDWAVAYVADCGTAVVSFVAEGIGGFGMREFLSAASR